MKHQFNAGVLVVLALILLATLSLRTKAWQHNQTAVATLTHLTRTTSCAVDEASLQWTGEMPTSTPTPYLQAVISSAIGTTMPSPPQGEWMRDPRLYYWFLAQTAVKNKAYHDSLTYLAAADAGSMLNAAGHFAPTEACLVINWTIANEIGYSEPIDEYVRIMLFREQWEPVVEAFNRLLQYDSNRAAWRLSLAKAYVGMGEMAAAEETLAPVLLEGTVDEIEAANKLLQAGP